MTGATAGRTRKGTGTDGFPLAALVPPPAGALFAEWWAGTERRQLLVQHCRACGASQHYPRAVCTSCGGAELGFEPSAGSAVLYSYTTVWRAPHPDLATPYVVALVRLAEGPLLLTRLQGAEEGSVACDEPLRLEWAPLPDGRALPVFVPDRRPVDEP